MDVQSADFDGTMPESMSAQNTSPITSELRSFGRRRARKTTARQRMLVDHALPLWRVDPSAPQLSDPQAIFGNNASETWLEIGFGGGEHLLWQAEQNPHVGFIGCEPFIDGTIKVLDAIESRDMANIRLYDDDARHVLRWLPQACVSRVFVLFPDPWPKKRHNKRRLLNAATLNLIASVMQSGAELRIATDIGDYARSILLEMQDVASLIWTAKNPHDWRIRPADWPETRYERKALKEGRCCYYFHFEKTNTMEQCPKY